MFPYAQQPYGGHPEPPWKPKRQIDDSPPSNRLFIVAKTIYPEEFSEAMQFLRGLEEIHCPMTPQRGSIPPAPRGFAYATFSTIDDATAGMHAINVMAIRGVPLKAVFAEALKAPQNPRQQGFYGSASQSHSSGFAPPFHSGPPPPKIVVDHGPPTNRLFIVGRGLYEEVLNSIVGPFTGFVNSYVKLNPDGGTKGYAYATFASVEDATAALHALNGVEVNGQLLKVVYALELNDSKRNNAVHSGPWQDGGPPPKRAFTSPYAGGYQAPAVPMVSAQRFAPSQPVFPAVPVRARPTPTPATRPPPTGGVPEVTINDDIPDCPPPNLDIDSPPFTRLYYVLSHDCAITADNLVSLFRRYPGLQYVQRGPDRTHGSVKYDNEASAIVALQELDMKRLGTGTLKVAVAKPLTDETSCS